MCHIYFIHWTFDLIIRRGTGDAYYYGGLHCYVRFEPFMRVSLNCDRDVPHLCRPNLGGENSRAPTQRREPCRRVVPPPTNIPPSGVNIEGLNFSNLFAPTMSSVPRFVGRRAVVAQSSQSAASWACFSCRASQQFHNQWRRQLSSDSSTTPRGKTTTTQEQTLGTKKQQQSRAWRWFSTEGASRRQQQQGQQQQPQQQQQTTRRTGVSPEMEKVRLEYKKRNQSTMYYVISIILGTVAFSYGSVPMYKMVCLVLDSSIPLPALFACHVARLLTYSCNDNRSAKPPAGAANPCAPTAPAVPLVVPTRTSTSPPSSSPSRTPSACA